MRQEYSAFWLYNPTLIRAATRLATPLLVAFQTNARRCVAEPITPKIASARAER